MFELTEREQEILEKEGWRLNEINETKGNCYVEVEIENWSPAGEDLPETIFIEEGETFAHAVRKWANSFDIDDHVELWAECRGTRGVPSSIRELLDDAEAIQEMFNDLAEALEDAENFPDDGELREYHIPFVRKINGLLRIEARSKEEAIEKARQTLNSSVPSALEEFCSSDHLSLDEEKPIEVR